MTTVIPTTQSTDRRHEIVTTRDHMLHLFADESWMGRFDMYAVTLSSRIKSERFAFGGAMDQMWSKHMMEKFKKHLSERARRTVYDYYVIEQSDLSSLLDCGEDISSAVGGYYHLHGIVSIGKEFSHKIIDDGGLNKPLSRNLSALLKKGNYRPYCVNSFEVKKIHDVGGWVRYITKTRRNALH